MSDLFTPLENGMGKLLKMMGDNHPEEADARVLEFRLGENIKQARVIYDDDSNKGTRAMLMYDLNQFAIRTINQNFNQLCGLNHYPQPPPPNAHDYLTSAYSYITLVRNIAENAQSLFQKKLWKTDCERIARSFQLIGKPKPYDNSTHIPLLDVSLSSLEVALFSISNQVYQLEQLINDFCPWCRESSTSAKKQQQKISEELRYLLKKDVQKASDLLNDSIRLFENFRAET